MKPANKKAQQVADAFLNAKRKLEEGGHVIQEKRKKVSDILDEDA